MVLVRQANRAVKMGISRSAGASRRISRISRISFGVGVVRYERYEMRELRRIGRRLRRRQHRADDLVVTGAAGQVRREEVAGVVFGGVRVFVQEGLGGDDE